jgi:hypothetical protein
MRLPTVRRCRLAAWTAALILGTSLPARAQHRPLQTQDPEVIGEGRVLVEAGLETGANVFYPVSGLTGDRLAVPIGVSVGLGKVAEFQIDTGYQWLAIDRREPAPLDGRVRDGDRTHDVVDAVVATKIRVLREGARRPALGVRFATELPNASNETGLGQDTLNFAASLLAAKTVGPYRVAGNAGVALLSDVIEGSLQEDAFVGSLSVARALTPALDVVAEVSGRKVLFADVPPIGAEPRGAVRAAVRYTRGPWRADAGLVVGTSRQEPDVGLIVGLTWIVQR